MNRQGLCDALLRAVWSVYFLCIALTVVLLLFFEYNIGYLAKPWFFMSNLPLFLLSGVLFGGGAAGGSLLFKRVLRLERQGKGIFAASLVCFLFQVYFCYNARFNTGWDVAVLQANAEMIAEGASANLSNAYFSRYPNNIFLVYLFAVLKNWDRAAGILEPWEGIMLILTVQCAASSVTGFLLFKLVEKMSSAGWAWAAWIFYFILLGSSGWILIPYSDSMGLIFPTAILYLYYAAKDEKRLWLKLCLITFAAYWGCHIKPQIAVVVLAILAVELLELIRGSSVFMKYLLRSGRIMVIMAVLAASAMLFGQMVRATGLEIDKEKRFGIAHYFMMGLNEGSQGNYSEDDVLFSDGFDTVRERDGADWRESVKRIREMGADGLFRHIISKQMNNFGDGTYTWVIEKSFCPDVPELKNRAASGWLRSVCLGPGEKNNLYDAVKQGAWLLILALSLGLAGRVRKGADRETAAVVTTLLGITLFILLFESCARYLYIYVPFFIMAGVLGAKELVCGIKKQYPSKIFCNPTTGN